MKVLGLTIPNGLHLHVLHSEGLVGYDPVVLIKHSAVLYDVPDSFRTCHPDTVLIYCKNLLKAKQCLFIGQKLEAKLRELKQATEGANDE